MTSDVTRQHFDRGAASYYDKNYASPTTRHERAIALRREVCLELLGDAPPEPILDLGCGPGALAVPLARRGHAIVAFDLAPQMVFEARRLIGDEARAGYCVGDAVALPFASGSFGAVVTTGVLEYVPDVARAVAEIARVLRPGGMLVATASLPRRLERVVTGALGPLVMSLKGRPSGPAPFHRAFTGDELDLLVAGAGLSIDARRFSCFAPFPLDAIYPPAVTWIDRHLGRWLDDVELARRGAKTYIVRARRP